MDWLTAGVMVLFFWVLIGQYAYREAKQENRSFPKLRGIFWGVIGVIGAATYLMHIQGQEKNRLAWLGFSILLVLYWAVGTFGIWGLNGGFYSWAGLFTGVLILYWQFNLETVAPENRPASHQ